MPNMPGEFISDGVEQLDRPATEASLAQFINHTLSRVENIQVDRLDQVVGQWRAIENADVDEHAFCRLAGRMGIDPYNPDELTTELAEFLESLARPDEPLVRDLTEVALPESVAAQWSWIDRASRNLELGPCSTVLGGLLPSAGLTPPEYGYQLARQLRAAANHESGPIESVEETASAALLTAFRMEQGNSVPGYGIRALVGQTRSDGIIATGPEQPFLFSRRFMTARCVFHALATTQDSQRLVTDAYSWDQKASRAFAAEFLAPRQVLLSRLHQSTADQQILNLLSEEFCVSTIVIEKQLENAGVPVSYD